MLAMFLESSNGLVGIVFEESASRHIHVKICIYYVILVKVNGDQNKSKYWLGFDT